MFQQNNNWYGLVINASNTIARLTFGSSLSNTPTIVNLGNIGSLNNPRGLCPVLVNESWYVFVTNGTSTSSTITRLDFGNSLLNTPTGVNLGNISSALAIPYDISIVKECGQIFGYITNNHINKKDIVKLTFPNGITSTPTGVSLGNFAGFNGLTGMSNQYRVGDSLFILVLNLSGSTFSKVCLSNFPSSSISSSTLKNPTPIVYNTTGSYTVKLTVDEGLPTQSNFCKQINVVNINPPTSIGKLNGDSILSMSQNFSTYTVPNIANATSYIWSLSNIGLQDTTRINSKLINFNSNFDNGTLSVKGNNVCGSSPISSLFIKKLKLKLRLATMLQGLYLGSGNMSQTMEFDNNLGDMTPKFINPPFVDTLSVLIRSASPPSYYVLAEFHNVGVYDNGSISDIIIPTNLSGYNYIVINHRNSLETWSDSVNFSDTLINYNFFLKPVSSQFPNNMIPNYVNNTYEGSLIWTGEVMQDGIINIFDLASVFDIMNDPNAPVGYFTEDLNGDGIVNIFDLSLVFDNMNIGAGSVNPFTLKKK